MLKMGHRRWVLLIGQLYADPKNIEGTIGNTISYAVDRPGITDGHRGTLRSGRLVPIGLALRSDSLARMGSLILGLCDHKVFCVLGKVLLLVLLLSYPRP